MAADFAGSPAHHCITHSPRGPRVPGARTATMARLATMRTLPPMLDLTHTVETSATPRPASHQRVDGAAAAEFAAGPGGGVLRRLAQRGSGKAMLPRVHGRATEVVFLNTAGGLTGGDRLSFSLAAGAGARVTGTTQTAERAYRSGSGVARVEVSLSAGAGARLDWLPQETILFDAAALDRVTRAEIAPDATLLLCETIVVGRRAMGETVSRVALSDRREIRRGGVLLHLDAFALHADALAPRPALLAGARAIGTVVLVAPDAEDALDALRSAAAAVDGVRAAASAWGGRLVLRLAAPDAWPLRRATAALLSILRGGAPAPRVWQT